jgi:hypothetical protein
MASIPRRRMEWSVIQAGPSNRRCASRSHPHPRGAGWPANGHHGRRQSLDTRFVRQRLVLVDLAAMDEDVLRIRAAADALGVPLRS